MAGNIVVSVVASNRFGLGAGSITLRVSPVVGWGYDELGLANVPAGLSNVVAIAEGASHALALTSEGRVVAWGANESGGSARPAPTPAPTGFQSPIRTRRMGCEMVTTE